MNGLVEPMLDQNKENMGDMLTELNKNNEPMRWGHNWHDYPIPVKQKTKSAHSVFQIETEIEEIDRKIRQLTEHRNNERKKRVRLDHDAYRQQRLAKEEIARDAVR